MEFEHKKYCNWIISLVILLICIFDYKDKDTLINAIEKTWKNYPIFNLGYEEITFMKFDFIWRCSRYSSNVKATKFIIQKYIIKILKIRLFISF